MGADWPHCAIATGPKAGASMTSSRNLAVQRETPHIREENSSTQYPAPLRYHFCVHSLAQRLLTTIRKQDFVRAGDRVAVAVSGGADSVALLTLLLELRAESGIVLSVAHVNHKLRGDESDEDERFVAQLAREHAMDLHVGLAPVDARSSGIEAAARELRYGFFRELAREGRATKIVTAHTLDDQAETVLLRIFRGTGIRGLAGIHPRIIFEDAARAFGEVVRPLLGVRRAALLDYLRATGQKWREDSSNQSADFLRNRLRHRLLPVITEEFGQAAVEHMAELAEIARAEDQHWVVHPEVRTESGGGSEAPHLMSLPIGSLPIGSLLALPLASQRRLVRNWMGANTPGLATSFRLIEEVLDLARGKAGGRLDMPDGWSLRSEQQELQLFPGSGAVADYQYVLAVPGAVEVRELGARIEARVVGASAVPDEERGQLLDPARIPKQIVIRNWRPGDRFWPAHTRSAKKVKELLSDRHATGAEKKLWPIAAAEDGEIVWMRGFAVPAAVRAPEGAMQAIWIRETASMM
jgi:tRNA(Ile)-lysidine synthase